jgi:hypothetical protein
METLAKGLVAAGLLTLAACGGGRGDGADGMDEGMEIEVPVKPGESSGRSEEE